MRPTQPPTTRSGRLRANRAQQREQDITLSEGAIGDAQDRLTRLLSRVLPKKQGRFYQAAYWLTFGAFYGLMLIFVTPTLDKSLTWLSLLLCALIILSEKDRRTSWLIFIAGSGLGYFLELWGTTRQCWTYYTYQTPPFFAVLAHGMAAVAFWRGGLLVKLAVKTIRDLLVPTRKRMLRSS